MPTRNVFSTDNLNVVAAAVTLGAKIDSLALSPDGRRTIFTLSGDLPPDFPVQAFTADHVIPLAKFLQVSQMVQAVIFQHRQSTKIGGR